MYQPHAGDPGLRAALAATAVGIPEVLEAEAPT